MLQLSFLSVGGSVVTQELCSSHYPLHKSSLECKERKILYNKIILEAEQQSPRNFWKLNISLSFCLWFLSRLLPFKLILKLSWCCENLFILEQILSLVYAGCLSLGAWFCNWSIDLGCLPLDFDCNLVPILPECSTLLPRSWIWEQGINN